MAEAWWERDQIVAAMIVGSFSLTTTIISLLINARRTRAEEAAGRRATKRKKKAGRLAAIVLAGTVAIVVAHYALGLAVPGSTGLLLPNGLGAAARVPLIISSALTASPAESEPPPGDSVAAREETATHALLSDWLRAEGTTIRYRYTEYLPAACEGPTVAKGSWNDGWYVGMPVHCLDKDWLALDVAPLVADGRIARNLTYCLSFQDQHGVWARHGELRAPGLDAIAVAAGTSGADAHRNIGFRVVRDATGDGVVFINDFPRAPC